MSTSSEPRYDRTQFEMLTRSVDEWNQWRKVNLLPGGYLGAANLQGANLQGANLERANLQEANLQGANLERANLQGANLAYAELQGANLTDANLESANLEDAELQEANLERAYLGHANLEGADLVGSHLEDSNLERANLQVAKLGSANLIYANLKESNLQYARFQNTELHSANLEGADLRSASGYTLDSNNIRATRFPNVPADPWSTLRSKYTGPAMLWTVLALIGAIIPYAAKVLYWSAVNRSQIQSGESLTCENHDCFTVIELVLGLDKGGVFWLVPALLILYNALRGFLTYKIAPMRDEEDRSGYSPAWADGRIFKCVPFLYKGYKSLYLLHQGANVLAYLAFAVFLYNFYYWLSQPIWLPKTG